MNKWSWYNDECIGDIKILKYKKRDGKSRVLNTYDSIYRFCRNFGREFCSKVSICEFSGYEHNYVYKLTDMKKLRLSYYQRNGLKIPDNDYLVKDINKWNWYTIGMLGKIKHLSIKYTDGSYCKYMGDGKSYLRFSPIYNMWTPVVGYSFFLEKVRSVYIEDYGGRVYMFSYTDEELRLFKKY